MGVYIKGMEMPTSCANCKLFGEYGCSFIGAVGYALSRGERSEDCPLVPVPPHGRLIDADALKAKQQEDADLFINAYTLMEKSRRDEALNAVANIVNAPTVIPSEDGE